MHEINAVEKTRGLRFDGTINAGHILTFIGFMMTIFVAYTTLDKRVVSLEEQAKYQPRIEAQRDALWQSKADAFTTSNQNLQKSVDRLTDILLKEKIK